MNHIEAMANKLASAGPRVYVAAPIGIGARVAMALVAARLGRPVDVVTVGALKREWAAEFARLSMPARITTLPRAERELWNPEASAGSLVVELGDLGPVGLRKLAVLFPKYHQIFVRDLRMSRTHTAQLAQLLDTHKFQLCELRGPL